jgi:hypothetical protein
MISEYFRDMSSVMGSLYGVLRPGGRAIIVIGDSCYGGVHIRSASILTELCRRQGYSVISMDVFRTMRKSAQHGGRHGLNETRLERFPKRLNRRGIPMRARI